MKLNRNRVVIYSLLVVDDHKKPRSCEELELIGIGGLHFYLEGESSLQFCPETGEILRT